MTADPAPDLSALRGRFPGLDREVRGRPAVFADAPGGTQAADTVIEAMAAYLRASNANRGGAFPTSEETDRVVDEARRAGADLLGCNADEVVVGPNMTTLAFALSRSLARTLGPGNPIPTIAATAMPRALALSRIKAYTNAHSAMTPRTTSTAMTQADIATFREPSRRVYRACLEQDGRSYA